jgi:hypothetical protein
MAQSEYFYCFFSIPIYNFHFTEPEEKIISDLMLTLISFFLIWRTI